MHPYLTPLSLDELRAAKVPEDWTFGVSDRVRFGELDALRHVNNAAYLRWLEAFRLHYLRDYGISDYTKADAPKIVLKAIGLEFHKEMLLNEDYIVCGKTVSFGTTSFVMHYAVFSGDLRTTGQAVIVQLNQDGTKRPLSDQVKQTLITRDGAVARN
ncbi:thioesterase family protein [Nereida sp. MMG025]|uniref:acyl-CoA thioesterase n=1 Tax=Nereida sp. MMG025 TaxID=2909981 RepID=UPI001F30C706|nr:acyl-CoA thioesterase [Nereida sp. MMG025]MCF6443367.1 acyl-CoA thioesterase [Nereida sp. MMG025]